MMPLCVPVCGLSLVLISENEADYENLLLITIALTIWIKFSVIEAEDKVIPISLS